MELPSNLTSARNVVETELTKEDSNVTMETMHGEMGVLIHALLKLGIIALEEAATLLTGV